MDSRLVVRRGGCSLRVQVSVLRLLPRLALEAVHEEEVPLTDQLREDRRVGEAGLRACRSGRGVAVQWFGRVVSPYDRVH